MDVEFLAKNGWEGLKNDEASKIPSLTKIVTSDISKRLHLFSPPIQRADRHTAPEKSLVIESFTHPFSAHAASDILSNGHTNKIVVKKN